MCKVMEEEGKKGRTREMFSKVKEITRKFTPKMDSLKSRDGKVIGDEEAMKNRWKEYSEELYSEDKRIEKEQTDMTDYEIHSFIHSGHFYSAPSSPLLLRGAPDYSTDAVSEFHA